MLLFFDSVVFLSVLFYMYTGGFIYTGMHLVAWGFALYQGPRSLRARGGFSPPNIFVPEKKIADWIFKK